jgi:parallel beta-helix repeat protein
MRSLNPVLVALIPLAMGTATGAMAETETLTCRPGASITTALAKLKPGDVLQVRGVCTENVVIAPHVSDITLQGVNGAIVQGVDMTQPVISIRGRGITVSGLTVTGGFDGVLAASGSHVVLDGNTISGNAGHGILVRSNSQAVIVNSLIENNRGGGVFVNGNSTAQIGADTACNPAASANTIRNNSGDSGVSVQRGSSGRIIGNTITGNAFGGVRVGRGAQAEVAANNISANVGDGISAAHNSTVHVGYDGVCTTPNSTDVAFPNSGYGASCSGGGFITGSLGSLSGSSGASNVASCTGGL